MTPQELLALWDRAVSLHREYWRMMGNGMWKSEQFAGVKERDAEAAVAWIAATELSTPDGVSCGVAK